MKKLLHVLPAIVVAVIFQLIGEFAGHAQTGSFGNAASFNGSSQYIVVPKTPAAKVGSYPFTIEAWVNVRSFPSWCRLIDFGNGPANANVVCALSSGTTGQPWFEFYNSTGSSLGHVTSTTALPTNQWIHLAFTYDGTNGAIYTNANLAASGPIAVGPVTQRTNDYIGLSDWPGDAPANASIDEFRIWSVARTQSQLQAAYNSSLVGNETALELYYKFDSTSGTVVSNSATVNGAAYNGTMINGAAFVPRSPNLVVLPATGIGTNSAILSGTVNPNGYASGWNFQYGTTTAYGTKTTVSNLTAGTTDISVSNLITGLSPGTLYHFTLVGTNSGGTNVGADATFTTVFGAPVVTTLSPGGIGINNATLNSSVNPNLGTTTEYFQYGTNTSYGSYSGTNSLPALNAVVPFPMPVTGLLPNTVYHYRVVAVNAAGTNFGNDVFFQTSPPNAAIAITQPATTLSASGATLNGSANAGGDVGTYYFQYGLSNSYGNYTATNSLALGGGTVPVSASLSGLNAATLYHFRLVVANSLSTNAGADLTFTTSTAAPVITPIGVTYVTATNAQLPAGINPGGLATTYYFQYGSNASYGKVTSTNQLPAVGSNLVVSLPTGGLAPLTQYHFRAVASNSLGTAVGGDFSFWTPSIPYVFTGYLSPYLPSYTPVDASAALKSLQANDVFYLRMSIDPHAASGPYYSYYHNAAVDISFSVPTRGLLYAVPAEDLEVLPNQPYNPSTIRWDYYGVDSTTAMIFWCRDFNNSALPSGSIPYPLDLTGFHANGISLIALYNNVGGNPTLWECDHVVPLPTLNLTRSNGSNLLSWVTSDLYYSPVLQSTTNLGTGGIWQAITNAPVISGLTNTISLPVNSNKMEYYRLKVL